MDKLLCFSENKRFSFPSTTFNCCKRVGVVKYLCGFSGSDTSHAIVVWQEIDSIATI